MWASFWRTVRVLLALNIRIILITTSLAESLARLNRRPATGLVEASLPVELDPKPPGSIVKMGVRADGVGSATHDHSPSSHSPFVIRLGRLFGGSSLHYCISELWRTLPFPQAAPLHSGVVCLHDSTIYRAASANLFSAPCLECSSPCLVSSHSFRYCTIFFRSEYMTLGCL